MKKLIMACAVLALLGGCVVYPDYYGDDYPYYYSGYNYPYYGYYAYPFGLVAPGLGFYYWDHYYDHGYSHYYHRPYNPSGGYRGPCWQGSGKTAPRGGWQGGGQAAPRGGGGQGAAPGGWRGR